MNVKPQCVNNVMGVKRKRLTMSALRWENVYTIKVKKKYAEEKTNAIENNKTAAINNNDNNGDDNNIYFGDTSLCFF